VIMDSNGNDYTPVTLMKFNSLAWQGKLELQSTGRTNDFPTLELEEIQDKSKSSNVVKTVACVQAGWLVIQCIARRYQDLPVTQLEVVTIAYTANAFLIYWLWWNKPLDVQTPIRIRAEEVPEKRSRVSHGKYIHPNEGGNFSVLIQRTGLETRTIGSIEFFAARLLSYGLDRQGLPLTISVVTAVFGAIHMVSWNSEFASPVEELLWRICSAATTALPIVAAAAGFVESEGVVRIGVYILAAFYCIFRLYLIIEPFVSLRSLPTGAYDTVQWTNYFPHIF